MVGYFKILFHKAVKYTRVNTGQAVFLKQLFRRKLNINIA